MDGRRGGHPGAGGQRVPDEVKKQRGTFRPDRAVPLPPGTSRPARATIPPPPEDLDAYEALWWPQLARAVDVVGVYTEADYPAFLALVRAYALMEASLAGRVYEEKTDREGQSQTLPLPGSQVSANIKTAFLAMGYFGLTPAHRDRLIPAAPQAAAAAPEADPDALEPIQ